jgi:hypothetical protein
LVTNGNRRLVLQELKADSVNVVVLEVTAKFGITVEPIGLKLTEVVMGVVEGATELAEATTKTGMLYWSR